jgi:uncharacterized protein YukE
MSDGSQIQYNYGSIAGFQSTLSSLSNEMGSAIEEIKSTHAKVAGAWEADASIKHGEVGSRLDVMYAEQQTAVSQLSSAVGSAGDTMRGADSRAAAGYA